MKRSLFLSAIILVSCSSAPKVSSVTDAIPESAIICKPGKVLACVKPTAKPTVRPTVAPTVTPLPTFTPIPTATFTPAPYVPPESLKGNILKFGPAFCGSPGNSEYDTGGAYYNITQWLSDAAWIDCGKNATNVYRAYVTASGAVPGYWMFSDGLVADYIVTQNPGDSAAYNILYNNEHWTAAPGTANAAYNDSRPIDYPFLAPGYTYQGDAAHQRENALALMVVLNSPRLGVPLDGPRVTRLYDYLLGHFRQNFSEFTVPYHKPFMIGIMAAALARYDETTGADDTAVFVQAADFLWSKLWDDASQSFRYTDDPCTIAVNCSDRGDWGGPQGTYTAPDLNLIIYYLYAYTAHKTHSLKYYQEADAILQSGSNYSGTLTNQKQFSQNYLWSLEALHWRMTP